MQRNSKISIIIAALFILPYGLSSQNFWQKKLSFQVGFSLGPSDKRNDLFNQGGNSSRIANSIDRSKLEYDYFFSINKLLLNKNLFYVQGGLGYLVNMQRVPYLINLVHFDVYHRPLWYSSMYIKRNIYLPLEFKYYLSNKRKISFISSNSMSITFHKWVKKLSSSRGKFSYFRKWTMDPSDIESFVGVGLDNNNIQYIVQVRVFNLMFSDDALSNNSKEIDYYNPLKFRLGMGMKF